MIELKAFSVSPLAHCNAYWSTVSHKSDKFLSQSTLHDSLYFGPFAIRSVNLEFGDKSKFESVDEKLKIVLAIVFV